MAVDRRPDRDRTRGTRWPRFPHFLARDRHSPRQSMSRHVFVYSFASLPCSTWAITGRRYGSGGIACARYSVRYKNTRWGPRKLVRTDGNMYETFGLVHVWQCFPVATGADMTLSLTPKKKSTALYALVQDYMSLLYVRSTRIGGCRGSTPARAIDGYLDGYVLCCAFILGMVRIRLASKCGATGRWTWIHV
ncbi:hypothetical protein V8C34DRAFT_287902 [Trichoderma compactum]